MWAFQPIGLYSAATQSHPTNDLHHGIQVHRHNNIKEGISMVTCAQRLKKNRMAIYIENKEDTSPCTLLFIQAIKLGQINQWVPSLL